MGVTNRITEGVRAMNDDKNPSAVPAAAAVEASARRLAQHLTKTPAVGDAQKILDHLRSAQDDLDKVYAWLNASPSIGTQHPAGPDGVEYPDIAAPSRVAAELALEEAAQYGANAVQALERARAAFDMVQWVDEVEEEDRLPRDR